MEPNDKTGTKWAYAVHRHPTPAPDARAADTKGRGGEQSDDQVDAETAWRELLLQHMPFHALDEKQRTRLYEELRSLETIFLEHRHPDVTSYYNAIVTGESTELRYAEPDTPVRHIVMLQARLMEHAYSALRLDRYANAPINLGWMNLFRRWGRTRQFNQWFDLSRPVFHIAFRTFFDHFLRHLPDLDMRPIPHPWDHFVSVQTATYVEPPEHSLSGRHDAMREEAMRQHAGIFLDSGMIESGLTPTAWSDSAADEAPAKERPATAPERVDASDQAEGEATAS